MILVIADDITGAAETAAMATQYGLTAQVQTRFDPTAPAQCIALDTNTRSMSNFTAHQEIADLADRLRDVPVEWFFKKVDSVLRGHVANECMALMLGLGKQQTLLVPANPSKGRTIVQGNYFIHGQALAQTEFSQDPEYPARSSRVTDLLGDPTAPVVSLADYPSQTEGLIVAEVHHRDDLLQWTRHVSDQVLAAGAIDFFQALLEQRLACGPVTTAKPLPRPSESSFFVCGSSSATSRQAVARAAQLGFTVFPMPESIIRSERHDDEALLQPWATDIVTQLAQGHSAIAAIPFPLSPNVQRAQYLRTQMAAMVQRVLEKIELQKLFIEGGATARAILDTLNWNTLDVIGQYGPGVVKMKIQEQPALTVTLKPGSYPWPDRWWD